MSNQFELNFDTPVCKRRTVNYHSMGGLGNIGTDRLLIDDDNFAFFLTGHSLMDGTMDKRRRK